MRGHNRFVIVNCVELLNQIDGFLAVSARVVAVLLGCWGQLEVVGLVSARTVQA